MNATLATYLDGTKSLDEIEPTLRKILSDILVSDQDLLSGGLYIHPSASTNNKLKYVYMKKKDKNYPNGIKKIKKGHILIKNKKIFIL